MSQSSISSAGRVSAAAAGGGAAVRAAAVPLARGGRRGQQAALRVVPAAIQRSGNGVFAMICMALLAAGLVALLMMNTALAEGTFRLDGLNRQAGTLTDQQEQLTQGIDDLGSPRNLAAQAQQMGMVPAQTMAFIDLAKGSILGVAAPASPLQRLNVVTAPTPPPPAPPATAAPATSAPSGTAAAPAKPAQPATPAPAAPRTATPATATTKPATQR